MPAIAEDERNDAVLAPTDEKFWQRYSPHHEFSVSSVGSLVAHGLVIGVLVIGAVLLTRSRDENNRPVSMDVVQLPEGDPWEGGGGGGLPGAPGPHNPKGQTEDI